MTLSANLSPKAQRSFFQFIASNVAPGDVLLKALRAAPKAQRSFFHNLAR
jgi:O-methyltransferase involved in polyketide biosynthesis